MGVVRPSAAGVKMEPSVSQPPASGAAALEQEAISSPLYPAGMLSVHVVSHFWAAHLLYFIYVTFPHHRTERHIPVHYSATEKESRSAVSIFLRQSDE